MQRSQVTYFWWLAPFRPENVALLAAFDYATLDGDNDHTAVGSWPALEILIQSV